MSVEKIDKARTEMVNEAQTATRETISKSMSVDNIESQVPALIWQHKLDESTGSFTSITEDKQGLYIKGRLLIDADPIEEGL